MLISDGHWKDFGADVNKPFLVWSGIIVHIYLANGKQV